MTDIPVDKGAVDISPERIENMRSAIKCILDQGTSAVLYEGQYRNQCADAFHVLGALRAALTARDELLLELKGVFAGEAAPHWVNKFDTTCMRGHWLDRIDNLLGAK